MRMNLLVLFVLGMLGLGATGCASHTGNGALLGGTGGALLGAGIGSLSHGRAGEGALLGGAIGAIGGAIVGNEADRQDRYHGYGGDRYDRGYGRVEYERGYDHGYDRPFRYYQTEVRHEVYVRPRYSSHHHARPLPPRGSPRRASWSHRRR